MKKYILRLVEEVTYEKEVEANSFEEAEDLYADGVICFTGADAVNNEYCEHTAKEVKE